MEENLMKKYKYRYVVFLVYVLTALANSLPVNAFSSLNSTIEKTFHLSIVEVSLNTLLFPIAHTVFSFPCNFIINKKGIKFSYFISAFLVVGGMWLRTFLTDGQPYICLLGTLLTSVGGIFILNTPSRMALNWFPSEQVPVITFVAMLANLISMAIGITIPGIFITPTSSAEDIINFLRLEAAMVTVPFILLLILYREKPPLPPSRAAQAFQNVKKEGYLNIMRTLFTNKEYVKICVAMALNYGICIAFLSVLQQILVGIGYTRPSQAISVCGSSGIVIGIFANILYSYLIKTKLFKKIIVAATFGDFLGLLFWCWGFLEKIDEWWQLIIISGLFCFNHFSIPSLYVLYSTEIAFPVDQASAAGYLMAISQTFGFLSGVIFASLLDGTKEMARNVLYATVTCLLISVITSVNMKEDLRKTRFQQGKSQIDNAEQKQTLLLNDN